MGHESLRRPNFLLRGERPLGTAHRLRHDMPRKRKCSIRAGINTNAGSIVIPESLRNSDSNARPSFPQNQCRLCLPRLSPVCRLSSGSLASLDSNVDPSSGSVLILCRRKSTDRVKPWYFLVLFLKLYHYNVSRLAHSFFRKYPALTGASTLFQLGQKSAGDPAPISVAKP